MGDAHGQVHWNELNTRSAEAAAAFYRDVLGLAVQEMDMGGPAPYRILMRGEEAVGGVFDISAPEFDGAPDQWMTYFAVDDADAAADAVVKAGGEVARPPFDMPDVGRIVMVKDAVGAMVGLIQPASRG